MSKRRKKKKKGIGTVVLLLFVIAVCVITLIGLTQGSLMDGVKTAVNKKVTEKVMEQAIQKTLESSGDPQAAAKAKEIIDSIDEADKQEVEEIIGKYTDSDTLSDVMSIMGNGINHESLEQVAEYMQESISEEDKQSLQELLNKYGGISALDF